MFIYFPPIYPCIFCKSIDSLSESICDIFFSPSPPLSEKRKKLKQLWSHILEWERGSPARHDVFKHHTFFAFSSGLGYVISSKAWPLPETAFLYDCKIRVKRVLKVSGNHRNLWSQPTHSLRPLFAFSYMTQEISVCDNGNMMASLSRHLFYEKTIRSLTKVPLLPYNLISFANKGASFSRI